MKIITPQDDIEVPVPSWIGKKLTCPKCQTSIKLELGDSLQSISGNYLGVHCPTCYFLMIFPYPKL